jgi:hypothetical protein
LFQKQKWAPDNLARHLAWLEFIASIDPLLLLFVDEAHFDGKSMSLLTAMR